MSRKGSQISLLAEFGRVPRPTATPSDISKNAPSLQGLSHAGVALSRRRGMISAVKPDEPASNFQQRDNASFIHMRMDTRMKSSCSRSSNARDILDSRSRRLHDAYANHDACDIDPQVPRTMKSR